MKMCLKGNRADGLSGSTPTVVLVHGAWTDGSCWGDVISRLLANGLTVTAVQLPLSSMVDDVAAVRRALEGHPGPVILVGHAWGGAVITNFSDDDTVVALVYIAAFAPDIGQSVNDLQSSYPTPEYMKWLRPDSGGYLHFPHDLMPKYFAQDLPNINGRVLAATQKPIRRTAFDEKVVSAAWHHKPAWYLVTRNDRMIDPRLQHEMATRIEAFVSEVRSSHVPFLSRPKEATEIILKAVECVRKAT